LVELVAVLVIIGIIAAVISPSFTGSDQSDFNLRNAADLIKSDILFTQRRAMGESTPFSVSFTGGAGTYTRAGEIRDLGDLNDALTVSTTLTLTFNSFGEPDGLTAQATITLSLGGRSQTLTVEPYTGYVSIS
jgi:type II secretory pathway pseudopilin PulG